MIGAGRAGVAIGHVLARAGRRFVILEAGQAAGTAWRSRWDSLVVLFTPRCRDALPRRGAPGEPDGDGSLQGADRDVVLELADGPRVAPTRSSSPGCFTSRAGRRWPRNYSRSSRRSPCVGVHHSTTSRVACALRWV